MSELAANSSSRRERALAPLATQGYPPAVVSARFVRFEERGRAGHFSGLLLADEDGEALRMIAQEARQRVLAGQLRLLVHADQRPPGKECQPEAERARKVAALAKQRLKRYVFLLPTAVGPRIIKVTETISWGNTLLGMVDSLARREHRHHLRAQSLDIAMSDTVGYLEWRQGLRLRRAIQIQTPMRSDLETLEVHLAQQGEGGHPTWERFAHALAETHAQSFFHADLKGFHAFVEPRPGDEGYRLRFIDLARVSFRITRRRRLINLYQALRFLVPDQPAAQEQFVFAYCRAAGWYKKQPSRALRKVRRFLAYKLRTHPVVE